MDVRDKTRGRLWILLTVTFGLHLAYCGAVTGLGRTLERDYREYSLVGQRLLAHGTLVSPLILDDTIDTPSALLPPAYAVLVGGVYALLGVETTQATLVLQAFNALCTSLAVIVVFLVTHRLADARAAWLAAFFAAVNPVLFGFTHLVWDTSAFTLGVVVTVWMATALAPAPVKGRFWLGYGLWLGTLAMLNPALTLAYPVLVLWPAVRSHGWAFPALTRCVGLAALGWLMAIAPWTARNYVHFDRLIYVRGGFMEELWLGVCPQADKAAAEAFRGQFPLKNEAAQQLVASLGEVAYLDECGRRARAAIVENPRRWLALIARRTADYWLGTVFSHTGGRALPASVLRTGLTLLIFLETVILSIQLIRWRRGFGWLALTAILFSAVYCITHVQLRFRAPIEPIMAVLVGSFASDIFRWMAARRRTTESRTA